MAHSILCGICHQIVLINGDHFDFVQYMCCHYVHEWCFIDYNIHHHRICPVCSQFSWVLYYG